MRFCKDNMENNILDQFELPPDTDGTFKAKCRHCPALISGSLKIASNFKTHIKRKHREVLEIKDTQQKTFSAKLKKFYQPTSSNKYHSNDVKQKMSTDALIMFIAGDILPLSIVDSPNFRHFVEKLDPKYQVPSRKHLSTKLLVEKASEVQNNLKEKMSLAKSVNLTIDLWSNRQMRAFMGITGHFIQDWTAHSVMLSCKRFKGKHTAESIRYEYEETLAVFEIADKISTIVTDNASNMVKAFKTSLPGFEDTTDDGDSGNDKPEDIDCFDENEDEFEHLPKHSRCYAHTLQLVIKDGLKDCTSHMCTVIAKASKIVNFVRRSIHASEMLETENQLQAANATRWNSQLTMIRSILKISEEKLNKVESPVKLSSYERKILHELSLILDPFEYVTLLVQNYVSASLTFPVTLGIKHKVNQLSNVYNNKMVTTLKSSIETRLTQFEEDNDFILAAILDPRFKLRWSEPEKVAPYTVLLKNMTSALDSHLGDTFDQEDGCSPPPKKLKSDFFSFMPPTTPSKSRHRSGSVHDVDIYLSEPCEEKSINPLEYWKSNSVRLSSLANTAIKYLAIPSTSAPVERLFSIAGKVYRPDRCSLNDSTFETLMMIKCNGHVN